MKYAKNIFAATLFILASGLVFGQEGEGLFKAKCNTCHQVFKDGTGPKLFEVRKKWADGGAEEGSILQWVKNWETAAASDSYAKEVEAWSPAAMSNFPDLTDEQINSIFDWVDAQKETEEVSNNTTTDSSTGTDLPKKTVPNYERNLNLFYFLIALLIIQVAAIFLLGGSLKSIVKIELLKNNRTSDFIKLIVTFAGITGLIALSNNSMALEFVNAGVSEEKRPWLLVEDSDIYFMLAINLLALGVLLYLRGAFMEMLRAVRPDSIIHRANRRKRKVQKVLTAAVPIEEEQTILMHHEYDGIRELDNDLPPWWLYGFYLTILFAIVYMFNYHILKTSPLQIEEYKIEVAQGDKEVASYMKKMAMNVDENTVTLLTDAKDINAGKAIFGANCVSCHLENGSGEIGPNLTDKNWIYGFDIKTVFSTVKNGTSKGMPEHNSKLNPVQIQQVASYVLQLKEAAGKAAEGDLVRE